MQVRDTCAGSEVWERWLSWPDRGDSMVSLAGRTLLTGVRVPCKAGDCRAMSQVWLAGDKKIAKLFHVCKRCKSERWDRPQPCIHLRRIFRHYWAKFLDPHCCTCYRKTWGVHSPIRANPSLLLRTSSLPFPPFPS